MVCLSAPHHPSCLPLALGPFGAGPGPIARVNMENVTQNLHHQALPFFCEQLLALLWCLAMLGLSTTPHTGAGPGQLAVAPRRFLGPFSTIHAAQHPNIHGDQAPPLPSRSCTQGSALYTLATASGTFLTSGLNYCSSLYLGMEPSRLRKLPLVQNVAACVLRRLGAVIHQPAAPAASPGLSISPEHPQNQDPLLRPAYSSSRFLSWPPLGKRLWLEGEPWQKT